MSSVIGNQSSISRFYDLDIWKTANKLTKDIYLVTDKFPEKERYGIIDQIRRASSSVGANIAEGFGRFHYKDKLKFYYNARGSVCEVQNFIFLAQDLGYLDKKKQGNCFQITKN
jgi:four helix bundle protein